LAIAALSILAVTAWHLAERPTGTAGLVAQLNMLLGVFSGVLALAVALATVWYAFSTHDMVEAMEVARDDEHARVIEQGADDIVAAAIAVAAGAAPLSYLMKRNWRWYLPGARSTRERLLTTQFARLETSVTETLRCSERLEHRLGGDLRPEIDVLMTAVLHAHEAAVGGRPAASTSAAAEIRSAVDALRAALDHADYAIGNA
jgi:hypothetical protein